MMKFIVCAQTVVEIGYLLLKYDYVQYYTEKLVMCDTVEVF